MMLKCTFFFHPFSWQFLFNGRTITQKKLAIFCTLKHTFSKYLGANAFFFWVPEGRYEVARATRHPGICTSLHWYIMGVAGSNIDWDVGCPNWGSFFFFIRVHPSELKNSITNYNTIASFHALSNSLLPNYFLILCHTVYITYSAGKHTVSECDR